MKDLSHRKFRDSDQILLRLLGLAGHKLQVSVRSETITTSPCVSYGTCTNKIPLDPPTADKIVSPPLWGGIIDVA